MRQRLPKHFLKSVSGNEFAPDFYIQEPYVSKVDKESVIETVYNNTTIKASNGYIEIIKRGWTDGFIRFKYIDNKIKFYGLQETKRDVKPTATQLTKQLIQILGYYSQLSGSCKNECLVFCLNSAYFYSYILKEDIMDLLEQAIPIIQASNISASRLYKECSKATNLVKSWVNENLNKCHISLLDTDCNAKSFQINNIFREIYLSCL